MEEIDAKTESANIQWKTNIKQLQYNMFFMYFLYVSPVTVLMSSMVCHDGFLFTAYNAKLELESWLDVYKRQVHYCRMKQTFRSHYCWPSSV